MLRPFASAPRQTETRRGESLPTFDERFAELFHGNSDRLTRVMARLSGEPDLAADVVQDAFVRLHQRGSFPDAPAAWVISVALNLFRNTRTTERRRERLLSLHGGTRVHSDPAPGPDDRLVADETQARVRRAIEHIPERDRQLLLLRAEGYSYRELAESLHILETSVGTLLARAKESFRHAYRDGPHAP